MSPVWSPLMPPDGETLAAQMRPALIKFFKRKTGSAQDAEDLTQDVLIRALTHARWNTPSQAKGYIFRVAINCLRDRHRRLQSHGQTVDWNEETAQESGTQNPPERVLIVQEQLKQLAGALDELPLRTRTVFMLVRYEQMRVASVAQMLGLSLSAVNKHLAKAAQFIATFRTCEEEDEL